MLFSPTFGIIIALIIPTNQAELDIRAKETTSEIYPTEKIEKPLPQKPNHKDFGDCAEPILVKTKKCKHCGFKYTQANIDKILNKFETDMGKYLKDNPDDYRFSQPDPEHVKQINKDNW